MSGGRLFVIAAPSGAGKTSLVRELLAREPNLRVCVSHTTRKQRPNEVDGRDYHFVTVPVFESLVAADGFLEWAKVFDNYYGTSRGALTAVTCCGRTSAPCSRGTPPCLLAAQVK
jgi:guanylate kinase